MKAIKKMKKPVSVSSLLAAGMSSYDEHRGVHVVHASDLTYQGEDFCPREYALHTIEHKPKKGRAIGAAMRHTFDMGRDIEFRVRNQYLGDLAVGHWKCASCNDVRVFCKRPKTGCDLEGINCRWVYDEVRVMSDEGITAGIDLLVDVGKPKLRLVEIKTMIKEEFVKLAAPLAEHRLRTTLYLHLVKNNTALADKIDTTTATVLYIAKSHGNYNVDHGSVSPFKEYEVPYKEALVEPYLELAKQFGRWKHHKTMPEQICKHSQTKRASKCAVAALCFSGQYAPGSTVSDAEIIAKG